MARNRKGLRLTDLPHYQGDLWYGTSGPPDAPIVLVAESWGSEEDVQKRPLVGSSGVEMDRMLAEAGIQRADVFVTNLIAERPYANETWRFFEPAETSRLDRKLYRGLLPTEATKAEIFRLYRQIGAYPRKLVVAAGNWSLWGLSSHTKAKKISVSNGKKVPKDLQTYGPNGIVDHRGSMTFTDPLPGFADVDFARGIPLLPIIHPAAILRAWYQRACTVHDLKTRVPKALRSDWRPASSPICLSPPSFGEARSRLELWLREAGSGTTIYLANDVETVRKRFISVMGFADSTSFAMCIPFIRHDAAEGGFESYWPIEQEAILVGLIRRVLSHPNVRVIGQNYLYDLQWIQSEMGITPNHDEDTMLNQNVLFPGTPKDLGYLSSLYCEYHWYWKEDNKDWDQLGDLKRLMDYNCLDVLRTWEIAFNQRKLIKVLGQESQIAFKMQTAALCRRMMNRGVLIDKKRRGSMLYDLQAAVSSFEQELLNIIPQDFVKPFELKKNGEVKNGQTLWFNSPQQTSRLFYDILGFKIVTNSKTGSSTVGKQALMELKRTSPEFFWLFDRLDNLGSASNTAEVIQSQLESDDRMRCMYNPGGTETHRLASSQNVFGRGTNLQNLTKGEEDE